MELLKKKIYLHLNNLKNKLQKRKRWVKNIIDWLVILKSKKENIENIGKISNCSKGLKKNNIK